MIEKFISLGLSIFLGYMCMCSLEVSTRAFLLGCWYVYIFSSLAACVFGFGTYQCFKDFWQEINEN